ncbi:MAG: hypothetical protein ACYDEA_09660 [Candidatus Dormibacteria bacterium]
MAQILQAGAAVADITPEVGYPLEGYHREGVSVGVLDRLEVAALVLDDGRQRGVLVTVDNVGLSVPQTDDVRRAIATACGSGLRGAMVCYSHTHSGPRADQAYLDLLCDRAGTAAREALDRMCPAVAGWAVGKANASVNRRPIGTEGQAFMGTRADGPVDPRVGVLRVASAAGDRIAVVVRYSAHANVLRSDNLFISADWPGAVRRAVAPAVGCPVLLVNGSAGDVNPRWRGTQDDLAHMASAIGSEVLALTNRNAPLAELPLLVARTGFRLELQDLPDYEQASRLANEAMDKWGVDPAPWLGAVEDRRAAGEVRITIPIEVQGLGVGSGVLVGVPMETFTRLALSFEAQFATQPAFFNGYTGGWVGYLPAEEDFACGGYEVSWAPISHGPETGWLMPVKSGTGGDLVSAAARMVVLSSHIAT